MRCGAARLHHVVELGRLALERRAERVEGRQQVVRDAVERGEVHGRREDVVRGLAQVDVVVRVHVGAREGGDHLVRVRVRARARARLEDIDRKLVVQLAGHDAVGGRRDARRLVRVEQPQLRIDACGRALDAAEPVCDGGRDRLARDGEVRDCLVGLHSPEPLAGHDAESSHEPRRAGRPRLRA